MLKLFVKITLVIIVLLLVVILSSFNLKNVVEEIIPKQKKLSHRGIYITSNVAQSKIIFNRIRQEAKACGIDTLVIDAKYTLSPPFIALIKNHQLNAATKAAPHPKLALLIQQLHKEGFIVTLRLVVFKDDHLAIARPDLAVHLPGGAIYRDRKGGKWADPYSDEVRLFNALIAESAAGSGADEIQFDYSRFPAEGAARHAVFPFEKKSVSRVEIINQFLADVQERVKKYNVSLAVDIFGVTAWQSKTDIKNLGQDVREMAKHLDVLSPMLYPSHFHAGYDGFANPGSEPYYFINSGVKRIQQILSGEAIAIVPWIQGFNLRSPNYGPGYILAQVKACHDAGIDSFLIWNARNDYQTAFTALKKK